MMMMMMMMMMLMMMMIIIIITVSEPVQYFVFYGKTIQTETQNTRTDKQQKHNNNSKVIT